MSDTDEVGKPVGWGSQVPPYATASDGDLRQAVAELRLRQEQFLATIWYLVDKFCGGEITVDYASVTGVNDPRLRMRVSPNTQEITFYASRGDGTERPPGA